MKKPKKREAKSGFEQGRSGNRPSLSAAAKDSLTKKERKQLKQLKKAKAELAEAIEGTKGAGMIGNDLDAPVSVFRKEMKIIRKKLSNASEDFNSEAIHKMMIRASLASILKALPIAEEAFITSKKENAAYALNALINQMRDLSSELKMVGDVENQSRFIRESIVEPMFKALAMNFMREMMNLKNTVETEVDKPKTQKSVKRGVDQVMRVVAEFMTQAIEKISADVESYLSGDMTTASGEMKKKKIKKLPK